MTINRNSMRKNLILSFLIPGILLAITLVVSAIFAVLYITTGKSVFYILYFIFFIALAVLYTIASVRIYRDLYNNYYNVLYLTTRNNFHKFLINDPNFDSYNADSIEEFDDLNGDIKLIKSQIASTYVISKIPKYSNLHLEYIDEKYNLVTFNSFEKELKNIITLSQSYRNVLIEMSYDLKDEVLSEERKEDLLVLLNDVFGDYIGVLFMFRDDGKSLLIYVPVVDSFSRIKEQIESIIKDTSITIRGYDGIKYIGAKFSVVAYPYSDVDELLSDLRYARRQGKVVNFYLPRRIKNSIGGTRILSDSMNHNYMSRILDELNALTYNYEQKDKDLEVIGELFHDLSVYLDIDLVGILNRNDMDDSFSRLIALENKTKSNKKEAIDPQLISALSNAADEDNSYYFSKRNNASNYLGRQIDTYDISSGFYYLIKNENKLDYVIYFFNKNGKHMILDTYLRESLLVMCLKISHYVELMRNKEEIDLYRNQSEYLMSLTNYSLYKVDDRNMKLQYFSKDLKTIFPDLEIGEHCYKAMFGYDKMCNDCPLKTAKKKLSTYKNTNFETSLTLNDHDSHTKSLLVERKEGGEIGGDLFNHDLLINSYLSLYQNIKNSYYISGRGYMLLLSIDSMERMLEVKGSEGSLFVVRSFIKKLKEKLHTDEFYFYNNQTVALLLHNAGHVDVINICEKIYDISKAMNSDVELKITYLALRWPSGFANAEDFIKNANNFYFLDKNERNKDFIYFYDHKITRSASKRAFIISVIEKEFSDTSFSSVSLQPIVKAKDKRIFGAEILLRINNVFSNAIFNAEEISTIAEQEGKTGIITEAIINFIGNMYQEHGNGAFKINNFERIAINIDSTYLKDLNLVNGIVKLNDTYNFPNNFLSFEIPEEIIPTHINEIQKMAQQLSSAHIMFSVDRYTGEHIGVEKLKELGFKEIKIARNLVYKVDTDAQKYNEVKDIVNNAKEVGIGVSVVGVENSAQYTILRDFDENMGMQGYHFYKPLSRSDFIAALISYER